MYQSSRDIDPRIYLAIAVVVIIAMLLKKFSVFGVLRNIGQKQAADPQAPAILTYYISGHKLIDTGKHEIDGMNFSMIATLPVTDGTQGFAYDEGSSAIYTLDLPYNTESHLVGLSKEHRIDRIEFEAFLVSKGLEKIKLEGDFSDYFDLYAAKGQQLEAREVLEPDAMAFVVDYCHTHFWEINGDEMYFVSSSQDKQNTDLIKESLAFVNKIKPALLPGQPGAAPVHHEAPYIHAAPTKTPPAHYYAAYSGPALACPLCQQPMVMNEQYQTCPNGHGIFLSGADLGRIRNHELVIDPIPSSAVAHDVIDCPKCHTPMISVNYLESGIMIDYCTTCFYHWLDADDFPRLS